MLNLKVNEYYINNGDHIICFITIVIKYLYHYKYNQLSDYNI